MQAYYPIIAGIINTVLVLFVVQALKNLVPKMRESIPWIIPILAGAIGPLVAAGQNALFSWLGIPIDLSAIAAIFTGGSAVAINQVGKQYQKSQSEETPAEKPSGRSSILCILVLMLVAMFALNIGCSTLTGKWKTATEDEKARLILADMQESVDSMLQFGESYVATHPDKKSDWQSRVLPLFKSVNDMIGENIKSAKANQGKVTVSGILTAIQPKLTEIETIIVSWGFSKKT